MMMLERVARAICKAEGHEPDHDWRDMGNVMLDIALEEGKEQCWRTHVRAARAALEAIHDELYASAELVSNLRKPYCDNDFGRAAAILLRCYDVERIEAILSKPPYIDAALSEKP